MLYSRISRENNQFKKASLQFSCVLDPEEPDCDIRVCKKSVFINSSAFELLDLCPFKYTLK